MIIIFSVLNLLTVLIVLICMAVVTNLLNFSSKVLLLENQSLCYENQFIILFVRSLVYQVTIKLEYNCSVFHGGVRVSRI